MIRALLFAGLVFLNVVAADAGERLTKTNELGPVEVVTTLTPAEPTIGDELVLEIRVTAKPDVEVLMPEFGEALDRYTIVDFVPKQMIADDGQSVFVQRYTLQPYLAGDQSIPPILIEFIDHRAGHKPAPKDADAYEILTDRIDFTVKSVLPAAASSELNPPLGRLRLNSGAKPNRVAWFVMGAAFVVLGLITGLLVVRSRRRRARRRSAYEIARTRLDQLLARPNPTDDEGVGLFFVTISLIVRQYLEDRFNLRAPDLTTEEFMMLAGSSGELSGEHRKMLQEFLRQADLVKFAGVHATEDDIRLSSDLALRFLEDTRENAPLIEEPAKPAGTVHRAPPGKSDHSPLDLDAKEGEHV